ncbi:MAG: sensor domain-containing diguanylate cyclase [Lachnospiraceae bacterium]|nr:sensor domain-containing diguanylate cyclase [Lachnospiraceae bacterium]
MEKKENRFSVGRKMYLFVGITVFLAAFGMTIIAYMINAGQIDSYFKNLTVSSARNFASFVDAEYLKELRAAAESEEYQELRERAEETDDEALIEDYLKSKGLWEGYTENRELLNRYLRNMDDIKYLYIVAVGDADAVVDMYLMDDYENPLYETGYYEEREPEFIGVDLTKDFEPTISHGDWGWLSSAYAPVYDRDGNFICNVGCDVAMDDIMAQRRTILIYMIVGAFLLTALVLTLAIYIINRSIIKPLNTITVEMKNFEPGEDKGYDESGVIDLDINSHDEIEDIYQGIRNMQFNIVDYLNDLDAMQRAKERAENDVRDKDKQIGQISRDAYRDPLTGVGSKAAYSKKINEMNESIRNHEIVEFAVVMVDVNSLKHINDNYGHTVGDTYLKGCCHVICNVYKHSPVYRIGGDEFVIILSGEDYRKRQVRMKDLKNAFEKAHNDTVADPWCRYSAAVGMAEYASDDNSVELVFKRADKAMYDDKIAFKKRNG